MATIYSSSTTITVAAVGSADPAALADWQARSAAPGVFFKENFNYTSLQAAANHSNNPKYYGASSGSSSNPDPNTYELITENALSGKSLRIHRRALSGQSTNVWLYTWDVNNGPQVPFTPASTRDEYYFQFIVAGDTFFNWPWLLSGSQTGGSGQLSSPKILQLGRHDSSTISGELVIMNATCQGFVTMYIRGEPNQSNSSATTLFSRGLNTPQKTPDWSRQPQIDAGTPNPATTMQQLRQRYGPWESDRLNGAAYPTITGATRMTDNSTYSTELAEASIAGVPWYRNQRTVVTVYMRKNPGWVRIWAGPFGQPQKKIADSQTLGWSLSWLASRTNPSTDIGTGFQLSTYVTGNINAGGSAQPDTWVDYIELIGSTNPIPAPGGFALP
jgi:hypothetical protein